MEHFFESHKLLVNAGDNWIVRELYHEIDWSARIIGIKGFRGVGKTTFLLHFIREQYGDSRDCLYVNLNDFYFSKRRIFSFADEFYKRGGKVLVLDQIHKYPDWSNELRQCYDELPGLQLIFSSSPVLRIFEGTNNLKDIANIYHLEGLSFREFLNYRSGSHFGKLSLTDILVRHKAIVPDIIRDVRPLAYFPEYLKCGYYPYFIRNHEFYSESLLRHINLALEIDVTYLNQIELKYLPKLRKLLQLIGAQMPFSPNVSKISAEIETSRTTVLNYLNYLKDARLIDLLFENGNNGQLQKPEVVYLHNTNLLHIIAPDNINNQNLRTTFFYNQVSYQNSVKSSKSLDFRVNNQYEFVIGGKYTQTEGENCFAAADMIEIGEGNVMPLWLFGFLY
ncbi:MAG: AAA family ATPase [Prolixibacteraceae bacterium]|nr:AAA family ATPase [Prolixibacteraceae bacterium]